MSVTREMMDSFMRDMEASQRASAKRTLWCFGLALAVAALAWVIS